MHLASQSIALFGKLPGHGDFVRVNAGSPTVRAMDEWLQRGLFFAKGRSNLDQNGRYATAPAHGFYYDSGTTGQALVGVLHLSRDRVGRKYPFVSAFETPVQSAPHAVASVPEQQAPFLQQASRLIGQAVEDETDVRTLASQVYRLSSRGDQGSVYRMQTTMKAFWEQLWGHAEDSRKYLLFKNLLDIVGPMQRDIPSRFSLVLRFPLGGDMASRNAQASFWIALTYRLLRSNNARPSFFWGTADGDSTTYLLLSLRPPPVDLFLHLITDEAETDNVCKLEEMGTLSAAQAALAIPSHAGEALEDEHLTLNDFLTRL